MKPLPKIVGWLSLFASVFGVGGAFAGVIPAKYAVILGAVSTLTSNLSHSLPGTGGKPQ
jgi:hypothetical protein